MLGFAVLNVVNAVFAARPSMPDLRGLMWDGSAEVQQTMKTASSDEELAFKQKARIFEGPSKIEICMYTHGCEVLNPLWPS